MQLCCLRTSLRRYDKTGKVSGLVHLAAARKTESTKRTCLFSWSCSGVAGEAIQNPAWEGDAHW